MELERPLIGAAAPDIELLTIDGERWRLSDQRGRPVMVIFHRHIN